MLQPQPPNSLDLNVLDLGFFNSIQNLQHEQLTSIIDELISAVEPLSEKALVLCLIKFS